MHGGSFQFAKCKRLPEGIACYCYDFIQMICTRLGDFFWWNCFMVTSTYGHIDVSWCVNSHDPTRGRVFWLWAVQRVFPLKLPQSFQVAEWFQLIHNMYLHASKHQLTWNPCDSLWLFPAQMSPKVHVFLSQAAGESGESKMALSENVGKNHGKAWKKCIAHVVSIKTAYFFWVSLIFGPLDKLHHFHDPLRSGSTSLQEPQKWVGFWN